MLRSVRSAAGLTQRALAQRLGTTQSVVSAWENGREEVRLSNLDRAVRACGQRLVITVEPDDVDRAQLRQQLTLTPVERLASVVNVSQMLASAR